MLVCNDRRRVEARATLLLLRLVCVLYGVCDSVALVSTGAVS